MKLSKLNKKKQDKIERELEELKEWQWKIYERFEVEIPCLFLGGMTVNDLKRFMII